MRNERFKTCGIPVLEYDTFLNDQTISDESLAVFRDAIEPLASKKVAILAPGMMAKYVDEIIPNIPKIPSTQFSRTADYDTYIVCCSPYIYFEVLSDLGFDVAKNCLFPFTTEPLEDAYNIWNGMDLESWNKIKGKYADTFSNVNSAGQYFDINVYLGEAILRARKINLHASPAKTILDIGPGSCLFPLVCKYYGHDAYGLDEDEDIVAPCYKEQAALLGVDVFYAGIKSPFKKLDTLFDLDHGKRDLTKAPKRIGGVKGYAIRFDLVTAFIPAFSERWGKKDYQMFFSSLRAFKGDNGITFYSIPNVASIIADEVFPALLTSGANIMEFVVEKGFVRKLKVHFD